MSGVIIITLLSFIFGLLLSITYYYLNKEDEQMKKIEAMLPGFNCNVCGFGSCKGMVKQALADISNLKKCRFLKPERLREIEEYIKAINK
ncbi:MAG: (Fe-S)-binding protein [Bacilli bacterium]